MAVARWLCGQHWRDVPGLSVQGWYVYSGQSGFLSQSENIRLRQIEASILSITDHAMMMWHLGGHNVMPGV